MSRPTCALIHLAAIRHNYQLAQSLAPHAQALGVVKANAYGHGAVEVARTLEDLAPVFAVACLEEAIQLRDAGLRQPILLLEGPFAQQDIVTAAEQNFWLMLTCQEQIDWLVTTITKKPLRVWIKLDTGMHRLGLPVEALATVLAQLATLSHVLPDPVIATHFAIADDLSDDFTAQQIHTLCTATGTQPLPLSLANSAGILAWPASHRDYTRPGIMLYGASPFEQPHPHATPLQAAMTLTSEVIGIRTIAAGETVGYGRTWTAPDTATIATVAVGYGDGYPRHAPNGTPVIINGVRCPLVGRVSMDMITVDVSHLPSAKIGDPVELWGQQLPLNEIAQAAGTISYELVTRMPARVKRCYV